MGDSPAESVDLTGERARDSESPGTDDGQNNGNGHTHDDPTNPANPPARDLPPAQDPPGVRDPPPAREPPAGTQTGNIVPPRPAVSNADARPPPGQAEMAAALRAQSVSLNENFNQLNMFSQLDLYLFFQEKQT